MWISLTPWKWLWADVSSVGPSSFRALALLAPTKGQRSKRQLTTTFTALSLSTSTLSWYIIKFHVNYPHVLTLYTVYCIDPHLSGYYLVEAMSSWSIYEKLIIPNHLRMRSSSICGACGVMQKINVSLRICSFPHQQSIKQQYWESQQPLSSRNIPW